MILIPLIHNSDLFPNRNQDFPFLSAYNYKLGKTKTKQESEGKKREVSDIEIPV